MAMLLKDKRIFIVEDNAQNRLIYQLTLMKHGARVEFDRWGRDTVWRLGSFDKLDVIILDLMLSDNISGFNVFRLIRQEHKFDAVPIVAVSASDPSSALPRAQSEGFAGFIAKPIDDQLFPKQLASIIAGEHVWYAGERYTGSALEEDA